MLFSTLMLSLLGFEQLSLVAVALAAVVGDIVATSCVLCRLSGGPRSVSPHTANACTACRPVKLSCSARAASLVAFGSGGSCGRLSRHQHTALSNFFFFFFFFW